MATTKFIESGTDATQDFSFYESVSGTVTSATDQSFTGPRSLKLSTGSPAVIASAFRNNIFADAGSRISFYFRFDTLPAGAASFLQIEQSGGLGVAGLTMQTDGTVTNAPTGGTAVNGTKVLSVNTWYRICYSYFVTNTTTFAFKLYINGVLESTANAGTLTRVTSNRLEFRAATAAGINRNFWFDNIYVDDGASSGSQPDTGNVLVTSKRPFSNGTTNGFTTQIGAGGSGYGTGHAPQVNEQPFSTTNGWSVINAGSATTEEYNIENASTGDVDISTATLIDYVGWLSSKALTTETAQILINNVASNISLTTTITIFTAFAGSTNYPAGTGTDIGEITSNTVTTVSLYECGIVFAYVPGTSLVNLLLLGVG